MTLHLDTGLLEQAQSFFEDRGSHGLEGTAMIAGPSPRLVIPDQLARRTSYGVSVELTAQGQWDLAAALGPEETYLARIHSHPAEAFHSSTDDRNPVITFDGAISIVVPYFGLGLRHGLAACAVLRLTNGAWQNLPPGSERDRWITADRAGDRQ
jgi:hypothetical protein